MNPREQLVDQIMEVMEAAFDPAFGEAWNRRQVADSLVLPSTHALVLDADGNVIASSDRTGHGEWSAQDDASSPAGFVLTRHAAGEEELLLIGVVPRCRRRGLGQMLIDRLFDAARARGATRIFLEMRRGNPAINLYRKVGFEPIGERPHYYRLANGSRVDAITFGRSI
jgi:ribosomal-protein-alanine N-acetyltransferase